MVGNELNTALEVVDGYVIFSGVSALDGLYRLVESGVNVQPLLTRVEFFNG